MQPNGELDDFTLKIVDAMDELEGINKQVAVRRFLGDYSHTQIAYELGISEEESLRIASNGLRYIKTRVC